MNTTKKTTTTTTTVNTHNTPAAPATVPVAPATSTPAPTAPAPAPYSAAVAIDALIKQAMVLIDDGAKKAFGLIKNGNYTEALSISKELDRITKTISEEIYSKQEDVKELIRVSELAPQKLNDKGSIKSQLKELVPETTAPKNRRQITIDWLNGSKKRGDLK